MALVKTESSSHWYTQGGDAAYGSTLVQARKQNLLPSVSTVTHIINNEFLTNWRIEQAVMAALTLPRILDEPIDDYARRVIRDMDDQGKVAREHGEKVHTFAEKYLTNAPSEEYPKVDKKYEPVITELLDWIDLNIGKDGRVCEGTAIDLENGYAGRVDFYGMARDGFPILLDFKTQNVKVKKGKVQRATYYDEWCWQLAAYANALKIPFDRCFSVVISSNVEAPVFETYQWEKVEIEQGFKTFLALLRSFRCIRKFDFVKEYG